MKTQYSKLFATSATVGISAGMAELGELDELITGVQAELVSGDIDTEGLRDMFDTLSAGITKLKVSVGKITGGAKASEYAEWLKKNRRNIAKLSGGDYSVMKDIRIDYPTGMTTTYKELMDKLEVAITALEFVDLEFVITATDTIINNISRGSAAYEKEVKNILKVVSGHVKKISAADKAVASCFDMSSTISKKMPFGHGFSSIDEFRMSLETLAHLDNRVCGPKVDKRTIQLEHLEKSFDICLSFIKDNAEEDETVFSKSFIINLAALVQELDTYFHVYGKCLLTTLVLQKNIKYVVSTLT